MAATMTKTVLITGCSSGFGRHMVPIFLAAGWRVFAGVRNADTRAHLFSEDIALYGSSLTIINLDVTSSADRQLAAERVQRDGGRLDCLINNAGQMLLGALEDVSEKQIRQQFEVNVFGAILLTQEVLPLLRKSRGTIINISSIFGITTWPLTSVYCACKFALEGLTASLSQELHRFGVRVVLIEPGSQPGTRLNDSIEWGHPVEATAYDSETAGYRRLRVRLGARAVPQTDQVAQVALDVANSPGTRLRVQVGATTKILFRLSSWFPEWVGHRLMRRVAEFAFGSRFRE